MSASAIPAMVGGAVLVWLGMLLLTVVRYSERGERIGVMLAILGWGSMTGGLLDWWFA